MMVINELRCDFKETGGTNAVVWVHCYSEQDIDDLIVWLVGAKLAMRHWRKIKDKVKANVIPIGEKKGPPAGGPKVGGHK
jgi:hypothetical protein